MEKCALKIYHLSIYPGYIHVREGENYTKKYDQGVGIAWLAARKLQSQPPSSHGILPVRLSISVSLLFS